VNVPLTAEIHREGEWFVAFCPEMPEANGQGRTQEECVQSLREAILLLLEDRRADSLKQRPQESALLELA
jgi:predicted RNase H-like HicB family nuclease